MSHLPSLPESSKLVWDDSSQITPSVPAAVRPSSSSDYPSTSTSSNSTNVTDFSTLASSTSGSGGSDPITDASAKKKIPNGEYLESLSRSILEISLNDKNANHPFIRQHMALQFRGKHDALPRAASRDDHQESLMKHLAANPNFHVDIMNASSEVDDSRGRATVYLWYEISGLREGLGREAVAVLSWERRQGNWSMVKHAGMRGPSGFW